MREQREGEGGGALVVKAAETHRRKLLTDEMSSPHSLHGHCTGGRKRKSQRSFLSVETCPAEGVAASKGKKMV